MAIKPRKQFEAENIDSTVPNFGNSKDWLLVEMCDTSNKMRIKIFSMGGCIIMFANNKMETAAGILRSFEKTTKVFSSSLRAKRFSL